MPRLWFEPILGEALGLEPDEGRVLERGEALEPKLNWWHRTCHRTT